MRTLHKDIKIGERTFRLKKMPAMTSFAILKEIVTKALPIDIFAQALGQQDILKGIKGQNMSIDEFEELQKRLLRYVFELLPSGELRVIDELGFFAVDGLEYDLSAIGTLLIEVIRVNYEDFFLESLSKMNLLERLTSKE